MADRTPRPTVTVLSNGVTLINIHVPESLAVTAEIVLRAGSRDETRDTAGLAHFNEHMPFKGTVRRPHPGDIDREISRLGGDMNAHTDTEEVAFFAVGPASELHTVADVVCDMVCCPLLDPVELHRERGAVLEEMGTRQQSPWGWLLDTLPAVAFGGDQAMAWSAIGREDVIKNVTRDRFEAYRRQFWDPTQMALVVCGGATLDPADAERMLAGLPNGRRAPRPRAVWGQGPLFAGKPIAVQKGERQLVRSAIAVPGLASTDPDALALDVLCGVLSGGASSRLARTVRRNAGVADTLEVLHSAYDDCGVFTVAVGTTPRMQERAVALAFEEIRRLASEPVGQAELARTRRILVGDLLRGTERSEDLAAYYCDRWRRGLPLLTPAELAAEIERVDAAAVLRVARRVAAGIPAARLTFLHPCDPATGLDEAGRTLEQQGRSLLQAALSLSGPSPALGV